MATWLALACRSSAVGTIGAVQDYAGAWTAERGRCHRFVYVDGDGRPANCPEPTVTSGWRRHGQGRWYVLDACARHAPQLLARPRRGYRVSFNKNPRAAGRWICAHEDLTR